MIPVIGTQKLGPQARMMSEITMRQTRGDACCYNRRHSEPGAFSGTSKWEIQDEKVEERAHGWHQLVGNFALYVPGWFTLPRLYAPLEPILNKTWRWNDIVRAK